MAIEAWKNDRELLGDVRYSLERLRSGEIDADQAHAEARLFGEANKTIGMTLEYAKMTRRINEGDTAIPGYVLGAGEKGE